MNTPGFERCAAWASGLWIGLVLFVPLLIIHRYQSNDPLAVASAAEATVGIGVVVRATARRLLTTAASSLMRTGIVTLTRASARTFMRRMIRVSVRTVFGALARDVAHTNEDLVDADPNTHQHPLIALALGFGGLWLSFWFVLTLLTPAQSTSVLLAPALSPVLAATLAALPVVVYAFLAYLSARKQGTSVGYTTAIDGLLLQAYFAGSGSFLPVTTDLQYTGDGKQRMWASFSALGGLFLIHLLLSILWIWTDAYAVLFASTMFLIFCFVHSFPIRPLEGHDIWRESKVAWLALWVPIALSFFLSLPASFTAFL